MLARVFERSISRKVADKSFRFGGELPKAIRFASKTSKSTTFVIIQRLTNLLARVYDFAVFHSRRWCAQDFTAHLIKWQIKNGGRNCSDSAKKGIEKPYLI